MFFFNSVIDGLKQGFIYSFIHFNVFFFNFVFDGLRVLYIFLSDCLREENIKNQLKRNNPKMLGIKYYVIK